jgi:DNA-binding winged helix-turn-helix (wHTH) protein
MPLVGRQVLRKFQGFPKVFWCVVRARFGDFVFDSSSRQLTRAGRPVPLSPKGFDLLALLLEQRPNVVTKATILDSVWPDAPAAADGNLTVLIAELRRTLGDDPQAPRYVRTVHRFGYSFCADAVDLDAPPPAHVPGEASAIRALLTWGDQVRRLTDGEHVVGRDPSCGVWLDVAGVSRRHARLVVRGDQVTIEDLDSTNGTLVDDVPVAGPQPLLDGQRIHLGPLEIRFRFSSSAVKTEKVRPERWPRR